jgi:hypothetical protein
VRFLSASALIVLLLGACGGDGERWALTVDRQAAALDDYEAVVSVVRGGRVVAGASGTVRSTGRSRSQLQAGTYTVMAKIAPCSQDCVPDASDLSVVPADPTCSLQVKVSGRGETTVRLTVASPLECSLVEV